MHAYKRLLKYILRYKWMMGASILCMFIATPLGLVSISCVVPAVELFLGEGGFAATFMSPDTDVDKSEEEASAEENVEDDVFRKIMSAPLLKPIVDFYDSTKRKVTDYKDAIVVDLRARGPRKAFAIIAAVVFTAAFLQFLLMLCSSYLVAYMGLSIVKNLRYELYEHVVNLDMSFFDKRTTGYLMARISSDASGVRESLMIVCDKVIQAPIRMMALFIFLLLINAKFTLVLFVFGPIIAGIFIYVGKKVRKLTGKAREKTAQISSVMQEILSGIRIVKAFRMEKYELKRFTKQNNRYFKYLLARKRIRIIANPAIDLLQATGVIIVLMLGVHFVVERQEMKVGTFLLYLLAMQQMYKPIKRLSRANAEIQKGVAHATRIFEILDTEPKVVEAADAIDIPLLSKKLEFRNVSFSYNPGEPVLHNISFELEKGKRVAIVGRSGVGKSTIVSLIPRFYDPSDGGIFIDGVHIKNATFDSLLGQIGMVSQEGILFNDTINNNIAYGRPNVSHDEIVNAAKAANAHDFIMSFPEGYETVIGERGTKLSGGERQRLTIARAIFKDPAILILDEATSSLDSESEQLIQQAIDKLIENRTTIIIAHRLSTVMNADEILVMEEGRIAERGRHENLIKKAGTYAKLCEYQFGKDAVHVTSDR